MMRPATKHISSIKRLFLILAAGFLLAWQQYPPPLEIFQRGQSQWRAGHYDSAFVSYRTAQQQALAEGDSQTWLIALEASGKYYSRQMRFPEASATLDSVLNWEAAFGKLHPAIFFAKKEKAYMQLVSGNVAQSLADYQTIEADFADAPAEADSLKAFLLEAMGQAFLYNGEFQKGLDYAQEALGLYESVYPADAAEISTCLNTIGGIALYMGNHVVSLEAFQRSAAIREKRYGPNHPEVIQVKTNIGVLYAEMGRFWRALDIHRANLPYLDLLPTRGHLNGLLNMGATLIVVGDYEEALSYFNQAESYLEAYPELQKANQAYMDFQRSVIYKSMGQNESSQTFIEKALQANIQSYGPSHPELISNYLHLGELQLEGRNYPAAFASFQKVYEMNRQFVGEEALRTGHGQYFMAETLLAMGETDQAETAYQKAAHIYAAIRNPFETADAYSRLAKLERDRGNWEACFAYHQKAWETLMPEVPFTAKAGPEVLPYWKAHSIADVMAELGVSLQEKAQDDKSLLPDALQSFETAIALIDSQHTYYAGEASIQIRREEQLPLFEAAIETAWQLYQENNDSRYAERAFWLSEKRKANQLRAQLQSMAALRFGGVPDSLQLQEKDLRQQMLALDAKLNDAAEKADPKLENEAFALKQQYRRLLKRLESDFPTYYAIRHAQAVPEMGSLQGELGNERTLLSYFWGEKSLYSFAIDGSACQMDQVPLSQAFRAQLDQWLTFIAQAPDQNTAAQSDGTNAALLAQSLLRLPGQTERLIIIPDGPLGYLPFESLLITEPESPAWRSWEWLGLTTAISYAYSATLWQEKHDNRAGLYRGFAPEFVEGEMITSRALPGPLRFNQAEIQRVHQLTKGERYLGSAASESAVKAQSHSESILHFATHAIADEQNMLRSRLYFASPTDSMEDGILYAHEIYAREWPAPLTVLSACQTGKGPLQSGEGVMSLARAFRYSGSRNVLTTLWQTDDQSIADLTSVFFQKLSEGLSTENALLQARRKHLDEADQFHAHPYFWAGYILIGEGGEIRFSGQKNGYFWWIFLSIALLGGAVLWWWKRTH